MAVLKEYVLSDHDYFVDIGKLTSAVSFQCLMSNYATALGATILMWREMSEKTTEWNNLFEHASIETDFSLGAVMCMLILDTFLHGLMTWYIEAVWPGEHPWIGSRIHSKSMHGYP